MSGTFGLDRRGRAGAVVAAAVLGLVAVAACGSGSAEPDEKEWSDSENNGSQEAQDDQASETATPSPTPEGPEEYIFVKKYVEEAIYAARKSGDTSKLLSMGTEDCVGCKVMSETLKEVHANGGGYKGDPSEEVLELTKGPEGSDPVRLRVKTRMNEVEFAPNKEAWEYPTKKGGREEYTEFFLVKEGGKWKVQNFCGSAPGKPSGCPTSMP